MNPTASIYGLSGVYQIRNTDNGNLYIGSSVNLGHRFARHKRELKNNAHSNVILQNAYNKHGRDKFVYSIRLLCPKKDTIKYEQAHLDRLKPKYNIALDAKAPQAGRKLSERHKKKLMDGRDKRIKECGAWNKNKTLSKEHCLNLSISHMGYKPTKEHKEKLSNYRKAHPNSGQFKVGSFGNAKISETQVIELRKLYKDKDFSNGGKMKFYENMGKIYNITPDHIRRILRCESWRNI
jgi:group I intron endonuclease